METSGDRGRGNEGTRGRGGGRGGRGGRGGGDERGAVIIGEEEVVVVLREVGYVQYSLVEGRQF